MRRKSSHLPRNVIDLVEVFPHVLDQFDMPNLFQIEPCSEPDWPVDQYVVEGWGGGLGQTSGQSGRIETPQHIEQLDREAAFLEWVSP